VVLTITPLAEATTVPRVIAEPARLRIAETTAEALLPRRIAEMSAVRRAIVADRRRTVADRHATAHRLIAAAAARCRRITDRLPTEVAAGIAPAAHRRITVVAVEAALTLEAAVADRTAAVAAGGTRADIARNNSPNRSNS